jgi:hypothetical protein
MMTQTKNGMKKKNLVRKLTRQKLTGSVIKDWHRENLKLLPKTMRNQVTSKNNNKKARILLTNLLRKVKVNRSLSLQEVKLKNEN